MCSSARFVAFIAAVALAPLLLCGPAVPEASAQAISVTGASPSTAAQGTSNLNVTISGKNFKAGATVAFYRTDTTTPGGIVASRNQGHKAVVAVDRHDDGPAIRGSRLVHDIKVTVGGNGATGRALFSVTPKPIDPCTRRCPRRPPVTSPGRPARATRPSAFGGVVIGPKFMEVTAVAIQRVSDEERIVAVGRSRDRCASGNWEWTIVRYLGNGELDRELGTNGVVTKAFARGEVLLYAVAVDQGGRIVIGGLPACGYERQLWFCGPLYGRRTTGYDVCARRCGAWHQIAEPRAVHDRSQGDRDPAGREDTHCRHRRRGNGRVPAHGGRRVGHRGLQQRGGAAATAGTVCCT